MTKGKWIALASLAVLLAIGIRFTGMPGWGGEDEENWKLVLFIRHLPRLTPKEIDLMNEVNGLEGEKEARREEHE